MRHIPYTIARNVDRRVHRLRPWEMQNTSPKMAPHLTIGYNVLAALFSSNRNAREIHQLPRSGDAVKGPLCRTLVY